MVKLKGELLWVHKKFKGVPSNHPQTEEMTVIQSENDQLKKEVIELKEKVLQITKENEYLAKENNELISQRTVDEPLAISHPIDINELAKSMARVSLKEKDIYQLVQEKN